eukprot:7204251-Prymnesium_polylepis.1
MRHAAPGPAPLPPLTQITTRVLHVHIALSLALAESRKVVALRQIAMDPEATMDIPLLTTHREASSSHLTATAVHNTSATLTADTSATLTAETSATLTAAPPAGQILKGNASLLHFELSHHVCVIVGKKTLQSDWRSIRRKGDESKFVDSA